MSNETKTHWKKAFNPEYIGAYSFAPDEAKKIVKIKDFNTSVKITGEAGREEERPVIYFEKEKPMILNRTNAKAITTALGSPYYEDWIGKAIEIYVAPVKAFGSLVDAVRVRPYAPKTEKAKLTKERFEKMLDSIKAGQFDPIKAKEKFSLTKDQLNQLNDIAK